MIGVLKEDPVPWSWKSNDVKDLKQIVLVPFRFPFHVANGACASRLLCFLHAAFIWQ
jgi:hypothetical protein